MRLKAPGRCSSRSIVANRQAGGAVVLDAVVGQVKARSVRRLPACQTTHLGVSHTPVGLLRRRRGRLPDHNR
jgi:hypothetical protein